MKHQPIEDTETVETTEEPVSSHHDEGWRQWHEHRRHKGSTGGLILILIGIIFLLSNFGLLSSDIWNILWKFWPIFLILLGLQVLGGRSRVGNILVSIIGVIIILAVFALALAQTNPAISHWISVQLPFFKILPSSY
jgi:hypothetical protein